jgi:hypothetical protein
MNDSFLKNDLPYEGVRVIVGVKNFSPLRRNLPKQ